MLGMVAGDRVVLSSQAAGALVEWLCELRPPGGEVGDAQARLVAHGLRTPGDVRRARARLRAIFPDTRMRGCLLALEGASGLGRGEEAPGPAAARGCAAEERAPGGERADVRRLAQHVEIGAGSGGAS